MGWGGTGSGGGRWGSLGRNDRGIDRDDFGKPFNWTMTKRLWQGYIRPYKFRLFACVLLMAVHTLATIAQPLYIGQIIDRAVIPHRLGLLSILVLGFIGMNVVMWWSQYGQSYLMVYIGEWALYHVAADMFQRLQELSLRFYNTNETGRVMSRIQNDVGVLQQTISSGSLQTVANLLSLIGIVAILMKQNWQLASIVCLTIPAMSLILTIWQRYAIACFRRARTAISAVNANLQENVSGVRIVQSLSREDENLQRFGHLNKENLDANLATSHVTSIIQPIIEVVSAIAIALVIVFGGILVLRHAMTIGDVVSFTLYIALFFDPIRQVTQQFTQLQRSTVAAERIFEILDEEPDITDRPGAIALPPIEGRVSFDEVSFEYLPGVPVLKHFSLDVQPGETIALVGHTGAGKSTIISLLARFYDVTEGSITIDGHDLRDVTTASLRRQFGMVLQEPFLFSGTVADNIRYGRLDATNDEIVEAARVVGAHDLIMRLDLGYDTPVRERGISMSMGERQLISFARAIIARPRLLILDEATANIDTYTEQLVQQGIQHMLQGRTSFVIAHRLATIKNADRIVVMREGRMVESGTHQQLIDQRGAYYNLYSMGFQDLSHGAGDTKARQETDARARGSGLGGGGGAGGGTGMGRGRGP